MDEYGKQVALLCEMLLGLLSTNLGLEEDYLQEAFGGKNVGECMRINYYPKCPQPHLTLGLSSHSDPGGMTVLLPDESVRGLEVRKDGRWILVEPRPDAFIVNIGDQLQVTNLLLHRCVFVVVFYLFSCYLERKLKGPWLCGPPPVLICRF